MVEFFKDLKFFILPLGFGCKRIEFFENQIVKFGGRLVKNNSKVTHVVIEESVCDGRENCLSALESHGFEPRNHVKYVTVKWLSKCLKCKDLVDTGPFEIDWISREAESLSSVVKEKTAAEDSESDKAEEIAIEGTEEDENGSSPGKKQKIDNDKYLCSKPSPSFQGETSQNRKIIEELEKLANAYSLRNDTWRSHGYRKAINALMLHKKDISTFQEACSIPGIGEKMAMKVMEIIENGKLQKVDEIVDEKTKTLHAFCQIWGVGPSTAEGWYVQGFRTLEDLKTKAKLTKQQQIGLKFYDDFQKRMSREEVLEIAEIVKNEIAKIHSSLGVELVGSFRRGKASCGDIDIMIVNPGMKTPVEILVQVTDALRTQGYLTDDLVNLEDLDNCEGENQHKKYFGVFKLPGKEETHRRIDLFVVPKSEYAAALMHYTGSAMFNRSVKLLAAKKQMSLTEHGLFDGTIRKGSEVTSKGQLIPTLTEEDIFKELGLPYRHPEERDH